MDGGQNYYFGAERHGHAIRCQSLKLANPDIKWEETEQINLGFEARLFTRTDPGF